MLNLSQFIERHKHVLRDGAKPSFVQGIVRSVAVDRQSRMVSGLITTAIKPGLDGLIAPASAFDLSYFWEDRKYRVDGIRTVYWDHDYKIPIGTCQALAVRHSGTAFFARTYVTRAGKGDDILTMIEEGVIRGFSCGFRINEVSPPEGEEVSRWPDADSVVRSALLLEYSIVSMPADPGSQIMADPEAERMYAETDRLVTRGKVSRVTVEELGLLPKSRPAGKRSLIEIIDPPASRVSLV